MTKKKKRNIYLDEKHFFIILCEGFFCVAGDETFINGVMNNNANRIHIAQINP